MPYIKTCERCDKEFSCVHRNQRYCSRECFNLPKIYTCQNCGKEFRAPPSQKRKYCSHMCFTNRPEGHKHTEHITTPCLVCGKEITILKSKFDKGLGKFCSYSCRSTYYPQYQHPKGTRLVPRTTIKCKVCRKEFEVTPGQLRKGRQFCSNACVNKGRPSSQRKPKLKRVCQYCGKRFEIYPSWAKKDGGKFCSRSCTASYHIRKAHLHSPTSIEQLLINELDRREASYEFQHPIGSWCIDLAFPAYKLAIEADGVYWHSLDNVREKDARKDADLYSKGWTVLHFTGDEIRESPAACVDEIVKVLKTKTAPPTAWFP